MTSATDTTHLPRWRRIENMHILLWLIKDTCWATDFRVLGYFMIAPTLGMAIYILWRTRHRMGELFHNTAIVLWISANSIWMAGEFSHIPKLEKAMRQAALYPFFTGLAILLVYYMIIAPRLHRKGADW